MAEMLIQSESLVAIADKIRVLSGTEDAMSLDNIQTKIGDANISVEAALSALINKGVNIPDGANIGDIADLIGSVETELPELTNPAIASELFANKELIDADGNVVTGTFTIDSELNTQDDLIAQIQTALQNKAAASEPVLQTKTVTPTTSSQNVTPDSGYDGLSKVTVNAMPTATQATPSITVNSSGLITASATQTAGYISAGTKSATKQLTTQAAQTITPGTSDKTIASGRYLTGTQTIKGDANLVADNIKSGVSIFGVDGSYEGSGGSGGEGVETATVDVIATGVTTLYYVGASGLCSISGIRNTVEMVVPSICYAELLASNSYFLTANAQGDCTLISSMNISPNSTAFSVTGAGSIIVPSQRMEM